MLARLRAAGVAAARSRQIVAGYSRANCEVAALTGRRLGLGAGVEAGLLAVYEQVDGKGGPRGLRGDAIPLAARIAQVAVYASLFDRLGGAELAVTTLRRRAGRSLDADLVEAFCDQRGRAARRAGRGRRAAPAVDAEPAPAVEIEAVRLDDICRAFGDVVDLKSPYLHEHAAGVSGLAAGAAEWLRMPEDDVVQPSAGPRCFTTSAGPLSRTGSGRSGGGSPRPSGSACACTPTTRSGSSRRARRSSRSPGWPGCTTSGSTAPATTARRPQPRSRCRRRILAAADAFQAMTQPRPHRPARDPEAAAAVLVGGGRRPAGSTQTPSRPCARPQVSRSGGAGPGPSGLTDRQVEVLRLLAAGHSNREIARRLSVSPRTAEHHVQDIYARIGVSTRASAALYAMQNDLLA